MMLIFPILLIAAFFSVVLQHFIPPLPWLDGARVLLMPIVLFYSALALPLPGMLAMAFACGLMWDAMNAQLVDGGIEVSLGWSIVLYAILGAITSGFRPLFQRGRWEIHCLASGLLTAMIVLVEYLMLTFRRGGFVFPPVVWHRIGGAGLVAAMLAPVVYFILTSLAVMVGYDPHTASRKVGDYGTSSPWP
jgi:hypothetical protein